MCYVSKDHAFNFFNIQLTERMDFLKKRFKVSGNLVC